MASNFGFRKRNWTFWHFQIYFPAEMMPFLNSGSPLCFLRGKKKCDGWRGTSPEVPCDPDPLLGSRQPPDWRDWGRLRSKIKSGKLPELCLFPPSALLFHTSPVTQVNFQRWRLNWRRCSAFQRKSGMMPEEILVYSSNEGRETSFWERKSI